MKSAEQKISEQKIRTLVTSSYDIQALRISVGNRIVASFNAQLGIHQNDMNKDAKDKDEEDKEATKTLSVISKEYDKITEAYVLTSRLFVPILRRTTRVSLTSRVSRTISW